MRLNESDEISKPGQEPEKSVQPAQQAAEDKNGWKVLSLSVCIFIANYCVQWRRELATDRRSARRSLQKNI